MQRPFFDNKKGIQKIVVLKIQMLKTCFGTSFIYMILNYFFKEKTFKSQFLVVFQSSSS
jgi:hypothetical protein